IVEQNTISRLDILGQCFVGCRNDFLIPLNTLRSNGQHCAIDQFNWLAALERADADFGTLQILQNSYRTAESSRECSNPFDDRGMVLLIPMRKVEAGHI